MSDYSKNDIDKFRLIVEQLEICRKLLKNSQATTARIAIILLDNLADILMYRCCFREFHYDDEIIMINRPRFALNERQKAMRFFDEKVTILKKLKVLNDIDAAVFKIAHSYRNAAYHRDIYNPAIIKELARIFFKSVCSLFAKYYDNGISSGGWIKKEGWLKPYGLPVNSLNYPKASKVIEKKLIVGIQITLPRVRKSFVLDINSRLKTIDSLRQEMSWLKEDKILDYAFQYFEFLNSSSWEKLSKNYRELLYSFISASSERKKTIIWKKVKKEKDALNTKIFTHISKFRNSVTSRTIYDIKSSFKKITNYHTLNTLLNYYKQIDCNLSKIEYYLDQVAEEWDKEISREIDRRRGK